MSCVFCIHALYTMNAIKSVKYLSYSYVSAKRTIKPQTIDWRNQMDSIPKRTRSSYSFCYFALIVSNFYSFDLCKFNLHSVRGRRIGWYQEYTFNSYVYLDIILLHKIKSHVEMSKNKETMTSVINILVLLVASITFIFLCKTNVWCNTYSEVSIHTKRDMYMQQNLRDDLFLIIYKQIPFMVYRFGLATIQFELLQTLLYKSLQ